jgi:hypothetical protein
VYNVSRGLLYGSNTEDFAVHVRAEAERLAALMGVAG